MKIKVAKSKYKGTEWGDTYYEYLRAAMDEKNNKEDYGLKDGMEETKLQFIEVGEENPAMVMTYNYNDNSYINIYKTESKNKVDKIVYQDPADIEFLYDIQKESYSWFVHTENETSDLYKKVETVLEDLNQNDEAEYTINKGEKTVQETTDGDEITLSKYDETFIEPEIDEIKKIDFNEDMEITDLRNSIQECVEGYKNQESIVTENVKNEIETKLTKLNETKQSIETAKAKVKEQEEAQAETQTETQTSETNSSALDVDNSNKLLQQQNAKECAILDFESVSMDYWNAFTLGSTSKTLFEYISENWKSSDTSLYTLKMQSDKIIITIVPKDADR